MVTRASGSYFVVHTILNSLVDTGASLTVMSTRVWESSNLSKHGMLPEYNRTVVTASGADLR